MAWCATSAPYGAFAGFRFSITNMTVRIQTEDFDVGAEIAAMRKGNPAIGGIASFVGVVRDVNEGDTVSEMTLEHYPGMTEKSIDEIIGQARGRWQVID